MKLILLVLLAVVACGFINAEDATPVTVAADPSLIDWLTSLIPSKWIAAVWVIASVVGLLCEIARQLCKAFWPDSAVGIWADKIGHWASLVGTSVRKDHITAPTVATKV